MWEISYSWKSPNFPSSQNFLKHMYPGDWTKEVQSVYTVFYAPDLFLKNAELPATSTHRSGLKECSGFMYQLYSLSQSEAGIAIPIWDIKNTLSYPSKICYSLWYFSYLFSLQKIEQKQMDTTSRLVWILSVANNPWPAYYNTLISKYTIASLQTGMVWTLLMETSIS